MIRLGLVGGFPSEETLAASFWIYRIGWIVWIISAGLYQLDWIGWIVSVSVLDLLGEIGFYGLSGLLLDGWDK